MRGFESIRREIIPRCGAVVAEPGRFCGKPAFARWDWGAIKIVVCDEHDAILLEQSGLNQLQAHLQDGRLTT